MLCLSSTNAATEMLRQTSREQASIKTFRFSDLLSATMGSSVSKKKRRNRSLYALSVLFLLAYFTVSASRTSHAHVRLIGHGTHGLTLLLNRGHFVHQCRVLHTPPDRRLLSLFPSPPQPKILPILCSSRNLSSTRP